MRPPSLSNEHLAKLVDDCFAGIPLAVEYLTLDTWGASSSKFGQARYLRVGFSAPLAGPLLEAVLPCCEKLRKRLGKISGVAWVVVMYLEPPTFRQESDTVVRMAREYGTT